MANNVRESLIGLPLGSSSSENDESDENDVNDNQSNKRGKKRQYIFETISV